MKTASEIKQYFSERKLNEEAKNYLLRHSRRFAYLLSLVRKTRASIPAQQCNILDIGPSFFTELLAESFFAETIYSLGYEHEQSRGGHLPKEVRFNEKTFFKFNLNETQHREKWITLPPCDIIIMAEVIEHLRVAPTFVLKFLHSILNSNGFLIIQTPNAASTLKRLLLLFGRNPYEMIRENEENPGHFREYTTKELCAIGESCGFRVVESECKNYFSRFNSIEKVYGAVQTIVPSSMKDGITLVLQKEK